MKSIDFINIIFRLNRPLLSLPPAYLLDLRHFSDFRALGSSQPNQTSFSVYILIAILLKIFMELIECEYVPLGFVMDFSS